MKLNDGLESRLDSRFDRLDRLERNTGGSDITYAEPPDAERVGAPGCQGRRPAGQHVQAGQRRTCAAPPADAAAGPPAAIAASLAFLAFLAFSRPRW